MICGSWFSSIIINLLSPCGLHQCQVGLVAQCQLLTTLFSNFFSLPPAPKRAKQLLPNYTITFIFPFQNFQFQICVHALVNWPNSKPYTRLISIGQIKHFGHWLLLISFILYTFPTNKTIPITKSFPTGQGFQTPKHKTRSNNLFFPSNIKSPLSNQTKIHVFKKPHTHCFRILLR